VESRLLLDVVVRKGAAVLELLAGEDEALLIRGDALLVLDSISLRRKGRRLSDEYVNVLALTRFCIRQKLFIHTKLSGL
jgi:hypothetical protein